MDPTTGHAYHVEARTIEAGISVASIKDAAVRFDSSQGQSAHLPGPADLLTAAFAGCILKNVERFSRIMPFAYERATVSVTSERQDIPPKITKIRYKLTVYTGAEPRKADLLHRNIKLHGTIYNTLAAVCHVVGEVNFEAPIPTLDEVPAGGGARN